MIYAISFLFHNDEEFCFSFNKCDDRIDIWIGSLNIILGIIISSKNISNSSNSATSVEAYGTTLNPKIYKNHL